MALCLLWSWPVAAAEVQHTSVTRSGADYLLNLSLVVDVAPSTAYAIITDDNHLSRLADVITESTRLPGGTPAHHRRRIVTRSCILFFCVTAVVVEKVRLTDGRDVFTTIVPAPSDFSAGGTHWRVSAAGHGRSRIQVSARLRPKFWIPPVIGTWLIRRKLQSIAGQIATRMEAITAHG